MSSGAMTNNNTISCDWINIEFYYLYNTLLNSKLILQ